MKYNKYQQKAINKINGNTAVVATAGSGKTSVLVERIRHMVEDCKIPAGNILAVSFSKKTCENLIFRMKKLGSLSDVSVYTFHALALKAVSHYYGGKYKVWTAIWEKEKALAEICKRNKICLTEDDTPAAKILAYIAKQKVAMLSPTDDLIKDVGVEIPFTAYQMKKIYADYEKFKERNGFIEFDDLINKACEIFDNDPDILAEYQEQYKYILVDEYQDISYNQNKFLHYLNANNNLFAVGDSLQAIYSFRGGDCKYLLNFDKEWNNAEIFNLPINYRCSEDIVTAGNKLAEYVPDSRNDHYKPAIAYNHEYKKPVFAAFGDIDNECNIIGNIILNKVNEGYSQKDIAVLTRTNAQLQNIHSALTEMGIGCEMTDGILFWDLPEVKLVLSYLKLAYNTGSNAAFSYCYNKPNRWLSKKFLEEVSNMADGGSLYDAMFRIDRRNWRFKNGIDELYEIVNALKKVNFDSVRDMVHFLRTRLDLDKFVLKGVGGNPEEIFEKINNLDTLENMCGGFKDIKEFLHYIKLNIAKNKENSGKTDNVKLMTIHKSKGLEFPIVFVSGCSDGLLPHIRNENPDDEKRLFYVAITRAEKELYLLHSGRLNGNNYSASPFIGYLGKTIDCVKS